MPGGRSGLPHLGWGCTGRSSGRWSTSFTDATTATTTSPSTSLSFQIRQDQMHNISRQGHLRRPGQQLQVDKRLYKVCVFGLGHGEGHTQVNEAYQTVASKASFMV